MNRRQFISTLTTVAVIAALPAVSGCQSLQALSLQPKAFVTGRTITPPQGCTELLKNDPAGDC